MMKFDLDFWKQTKMTDMEMELLFRCERLLKTVLENGTFYITAIELDPNNFDVDGIVIGEEMQNIIDQIQKLRNEKIQKKQGRIYCSEENVVME